MSTPVGVPTCYRHPDRETYIACQRCENPICPDCMRDAAVGFQCPDCVKQGAKETRSGRTAYGGMLPTRPGMVISVLIGINALVWLAIVATGGDSSVLANWLVMSRDGICGLSTDLSRAYLDVDTAAACERLPNGQWFPGVDDGGAWRLLTHAFTHIAIWHIAMNMLALWQLGPQLERVLGTARFLALYLISAVAGGVAVLWLSDGTALGASGAIFGLLAATVVVFKKVGADLSALTPTLFLAVIISIIPGISWQGHLGGFVGGLVAGAVLVFAPREHRSRFQALGLTAIALVLVGAAAAGAVVVG